MYHPSSIHYKVECDQTCNQNLNNIPTIVNGKLDFGMRQNISVNTTSKWGQVRNFVKESETKILESKAKYPTGHKHKVLIIGDSHVRGCAANMAATLDVSFEVCGVIEPGSCTESLSEVMKKEVASLTTNDFLIISSGSNDIGRNDSRLAFRNIVNYLKNVEHTNVITNKCSS
jgi:bacterioferritin-associated ferredoxin